MNLCPYLLMGTSVAGKESVTYRQHYGAILRERGKSPSFILANLAFTHRLPQPIFALPVDSTKAIVLPGNKCVAQDERPNSTRIIGVFFRGKRQSVVVMADCIATLVQPISRAASVQVQNAPGKAVRAADRGRNNCQITVWKRNLHSWPTSAT